MITWQYLAGFIDGEGYISLKSHRNESRFRIVIPQSGEIGYRVLSDIRKFLADRNISSFLYAEKELHKLSRLIVNRLCIEGRTNVVSLLLEILPFLNVKKVIAQDVIRYHRLYPSLQGRMNKRALHSNRGSGPVGSPAISSLSISRAMDEDART